MPCATDAFVSLPSTPDQSVRGGGAAVPQPSAAAVPALPPSLLPHPADLHHHAQHTAGTVPGFGVCVCVCHSTTFRDLATTQLLSCVNAYKAAGTAVHVCL